MCRQVFLAAALIAATGVSAHAATSDDIWLWMDVDRTAYLQNRTGADIGIDGYQLISEFGGLDPAGWDSISDRVPDRLSELVEALGAGALGFAELSSTPNNLAEGDLPGVAVLKAGAKFSLGKPIKPGLGGDVRFFFKVAGVPEPFESCGLACIPEPSTWLLAALGALGVLAAHRSRAKSLRPSSLR